MGKQGPCYHCGVTSTPLWRNGPPDKPVLCNACGSRWRTKGTLANYTPLHSRADMVDFVEQKAAARVKSISLNKNKEVKFLKRKQSYDNSMTSGGVAVAFDYNHFSQKFVDEETSNRSSSGSAMSNSDAQFGSADVSDLTGPAQSVVWDSMVPSRKRTCVNRPKQSSVEKLTKDLHAIMNEQQSSCFSGTSEDDVLLESVTTPMCSFEMGNGAVLFRDPSSIAKEEESEASSLSVDKKQLNRSSEMYYSQRTGLPPHSSGKGLIFPSPSPRIVKIRRSNHEQEGKGHEKHKRDMLQQEKLQILGSHNSPLGGINLKDVINFEEFVKQLTIQEQEQLLKYLPSVDKTELPDGLKKLFDSLVFMENLSSFQKLLGDGVFDNSLMGGIKAEECKTLKGLALSNFAKSKWVECHNRILIKESRSSRSGIGCDAIIMGNKSSVSGKRGGDVESEKFVLGSKEGRVGKYYSSLNEEGDITMMMKPKRGKLGSSSSISISSRRYGYEYDYEEEEEEQLVMESDDGCCLMMSPRSTPIFAAAAAAAALPPTDFNNSLQEQEQEQEQDLLLLVDSSSNTTFFPLLNTNNLLTTTSSSSSISLLHPPSS